MEGTLREFIDELINKHGHYRNGYLDISFSDLEQSEKEEFASRLISAKHTYGSSFEWLEPEHEHLFAKYLMSSHPDDKQKFLNALTKQAVEYFEETMCDLLAERTTELFADKASNHGLRKTYDAQTGEVTWL